MTILTLALTIFTLALVVDFVTGLVDLWNRCATPVTAKTETPLATELMSNTGSVLPTTMTFTPSVDDFSDCVERFNSYPTVIDPWTLATVSPSPNLVYTVNPLVPQLLLTGSTAKVKKTRTKKATTTTTVKPVATKSPRAKKAVLA